jgi:hypothetical protein
VIASVFLELQDDRGAEFDDPNGQLATQIAAEWNL